MSKTTDEHFANLKSMVFDYYLGGVKNEDFDECDLTDNQRATIYKRVTDNLPILIDDIVDDVLFDDDLV